MDTTAQPAAAQPASMIGRDAGAAGLASPIPAPSTAITPSAPPLNAPPTSRYLDPTAPRQDTGILNNQMPFLETGSGTPASQKTPAVPAMPQGSDDLIKIKQQALQNLAPLIDKLDQPPEERFKTLMMMIQASDNAQYLDEAYEAANGIKDEKDKAQALLDIVNEINYFTQNHAAEPKS